MARTGLKQNAHLSTVISGTARSNETTQWNLSKDGHLAAIQQGINSCNAWGVNLLRRKLPICGTEHDLSGVEHGYKAGGTHESYFEQVNLSTAGAGTASDKYILHLKYALGAFTGESINSGAGTATIGGKVQVQLVNTGGTQVLYNAHSSVVTSYGVSSNNEHVIAPGTVQHFDIVQTGTINPSLLPGIGETRDAKIQVILSDLIYNETIAVSDFTIGSFGSVGDYIGVWGYSFKLYNEGS